MKTPHKHSKIIKAWADGAQIQCRYDEEWTDTNPTPKWSEDVEYRVKPEISVTARTLIQNFELASAQTIGKACQALEDYIANLEMRA